MDNSELKTVEVLIIKDQAHQVKHDTQDNDDKCSNAGCINKIKQLEFFVEELKDQNSTFLETVLELEYEVKNRVNGMEELLVRTADAGKAYMLKLEEYEELTARAFRDKKRLLKQIKNLSDKISIIEIEKNALQDQNNNLTHDISSFIKLVTHARNTGHWDVGNIDFCDVTFEQVFGSIDGLSHWSDEENCMTPNSLPEHYSTSYNLLKKNSVDRLSSTHLQPLHAVGLTCKNVLFKRDTQTIQLQGELNRTKKILAALEVHLADRNSTIAELQVQITDLNHEISRRDAENFMQINFNSRHQISSIESISHLETSNFENNKSADFTGSTQNCCDCESRLNLIKQLQNENIRLAKECEVNQTHLDKYCSDIDAALTNNTKLEQEISVMESLWQELEAIKEENETLLDKLEKKCRREKDLDRALREKNKEMSTNIEQLTSELSQMKEIEERHRLKANGLEIVVQQLQAELRQQAEDNDLVVEIEKLKKAKIEQDIQVEELLLKLNNLEKNSHQPEVKEVEDKVVELRNELQVTLSCLKTKDEEIARQKLTINNLQDALVSMKRNFDTSTNSVLANDDKTKTHILSNSANKPQIRRYTSSGDVIDI